MVREPASLRGQDRRLGGRGPRLLSGGVAPRWAKRALLKLAVTIGAGGQADSWSVEPKAPDFRGWMLRWTA